MLSKCIQSFRLLVVYIIKYAIIVDMRAENTAAAKIYATMVNKILHAGCLNSPRIESKIHLRNAAIISCQLISSPLFKFSFYLHTSQNIPLSIFLPAVHHTENQKFLH